MKSITVCLAVLLVLTSSLKIRTTQPNVPLHLAITGGFTDVNVKNLNELEQKADDFVRASISQAKNAKLKSAREQVVAGMNICFTYENISEEICVWSKPWENDFLEFIGPDGKAYVKGGFSIEDYYLAE